jgi:signal peptidase I
MSLDTRVDNIVLIGNVFNLDEKMAPLFCYLATIKNLYVVQGEVDIKLKNALLYRKNTELFKYPEIRDFANYLRSFNRKGDFITLMRDKFKKIVTIDNNLFIHSNFDNLQHSIRDNEFYINKSIVLENYINNFESSKVKFFPNLLGIDHIYTGGYDNNEIKTYGNITTVSIKDATVALNITDKRVRIFSKL